MWRDPGPPTSFGGGGPGLWKTFVAEAVQAVVFMALCLMNLSDLLLNSSQSEESTDSSRAEWAPTAELEQLQQFTALPSSSTSLLRCWSLPVTLPRTWRSRELHQDTCNLQSEETKSSTPWSKLPLPAVVSFPTFTRLSSWKQPRKERTDVWLQD